MSTDIPSLTPDIASFAANLLDFDEASLREWLVLQGEPAYRAQQVIKWVHQRQVTDIVCMTNLSKSLRQQLTAKACVTLPEVITRKVATDGCVKWLFRLQDGNAVETVFIPEEGRGTLCISSQAGCALNCSFCATGKEGFNRNLTTAEIISQLWWAVHELCPDGLEANHAITNVVMMGMGEPLLNYIAVSRAMQLMMHDHAYGLSKYRVTLSTAGVVPMMEKLREDLPVSLAVSLHAPNNTLRDQLVPLNKKYPLEQLMPVCRDYFPKGSKRVVVFEYVMLAGINDGWQHAAELVRLLRDVPCKVNLIPFNPFAGSSYQASAWPMILRFQKVLKDHGIGTWVRKTRGQDIAAACGQLAGQIQDRTGRHQRWLKTGLLVPQTKKPE